MKDKFFDIFRKYRLTKNPRIMNLINIKNKEAFSTGQSKVKEK